MSLKSAAVSETTGSLPEAPLQNLLIMLLTVLAGALLALQLSPLWMPALAFSATGEEPKVFWYLSRGSALAGYWVMWLSMAMGIIITNKLAQLWPGIPPAYEIHQYTSVLGLGFGLFHALILMGDRYIHFGLVQVFIPFTSSEYRPVWVGIGQMAFYLWALVTGSFYVRKRIGKNAWRAIHFASYASFLGLMVHGLFAGTDSTAPWASAIYWFSGASLMVLTVYRVLMTKIPVTK